MRQEQWGNFWSLWPTGSWLPAGWLSESSTCIFLKHLTQVGFNTSLCGFAVPKDTVPGTLQDAQHHWTGPAGQLGHGWDMARTQVGHGWDTAGTLQRLLCLCQAEPGTRRGVLVSACKYIKALPPDGRICGINSYVLFISLQGLINI